MGHDLKFIDFSEIEQKKIEEVIARDEALRNMENNRISSMQSEVDNLNNQVDLISKNSYFKENHCLQCYSQFMILFNPKYACSKCQRNYCKKCLLQVDKENLMLCLFCRKKMTSESQKNTWFYENVKNKFKNYGSEKIKRLLSRVKSEGEDNDDDSYERQTQNKRPSLGDIFSSFRTSIDNVSDSGFSTASSRRNLTLLPDLESQSHDSVDLRKDVDLEVMLKEDASRSSWNLTPVQNRIHFSFRDNYSSSILDNNHNNNHNAEQLDPNNRYIKSGSSLSSEISDDIIDEIVSNNQFLEEPLNAESNSRTLPVLNKSQFLSIRTPPPTPQIDIVDGDSPVFIQLPEDAQVGEGETAEFVCVVEGTLPIEVYWYREGSELIRIDENESEKYVVSKAGRSHGFVVMETTILDRGYYMCIAVNDYGRKEHMVKLTVLDKTFTHAESGNFEIPTPQKLDIFVPPVPRPRLSRPVSTEVIRCGDFSFTTDAPSKPQQVFPDFDFVPLSKNESLDVEKEATSPRNQFRSFSSSSRGGISSIDEGAIFHSHTPSERKHSPEMRKQIRSEELNQNFSLVPEHNTQDISKQNLNTITEHNPKQSIDSFASNVNNNDFLIESDQQLRQKSYEIPIIDLTEIYSSFFNNSSTVTSPNDAITSDPFSQRIQTDRSRSNHTNQARTSYIDPNEITQKPRSNLSDSSRNEVGARTRYQNSEEDGKRRFSSDKPHDEYLAREAGSFLLNSTPKRRHESYGEKNENLWGRGEEKDKFYLRTNNRNELKKPSVKDLSKKFSQ